MAPYWNIAIGGFVVNLLSGAALFMGSASTLFFNTAFHIKLIGVVIGLTLTWWLVRICIRGDGEVTRKASQDRCRLDNRLGHRTDRWAADRIFLIGERHMESLIHWLNSTALNKFIMSEPWLWPYLEIFHFFGLCLLLGSLIVSDLRMLGFARSVPMRHIETFMMLAVIGFSINLITGILFLSRRPRSLPAQHRFPHQDGFDRDRGSECLATICGDYDPRFYVDSR